MFGGEHQRGELSLKGEMRLEGRLIEFGLGQVGQFESNLLMDAIQDGTQFVGLRIAGWIGFDNRAATEEWTKCVGNQLGIDRLCTANTKEGHVILSDGHVSHLPSDVARS